MNALEKLKVAVVAAGEVVRTGLGQMLEQNPRVDDYAVFHPGEFSAESSKDSIQLLILSYNVLLLWTSDMPGHGVGNWAADLADVAHRNGLRVVFLVPGAVAEAGHLVGGTGVRRSLHGPDLPCDGVLDQDGLTTESLNQALRRLANGERLVTRHPAVQRVTPAPCAVGVAAGNGATGTAARPANPPTVLLTARERQVLELLVEGMSNREIGQALELSEHSAKRMVAIVLSKLNSPNRTQAVAVALREGLVGSGPVRS